MTKSRRCNTSKGSTERVGFVLASPGFCLPFCSPCQVPEVIEIDHSAVWLCHFCAEWHQMQDKKTNQLGFQMLLCFFFFQVIFSEEFYPKRQNPLQPHKNCEDRTVPSNFISYLHFCCKPYTLFRAVPSPLQALFPRGVKHPAFQRGCGTQ